MGKAFDLDVTVRGLWRTLGPKAATIEAYPRSTIEPRTIDPDSSGAQAMRELGDRGAKLLLTFGTTLGEGGMGVVREATQLSVGRAVAVKTLREANPTRASAMKLLREGWLTASLEHPNVVPVYDLGLDETERPQVVLKKIDGQPWSRLIDAPEALRERLGPGDPLEHNLGILMQLCNAVGFAHSRGISHRDLKPENVMIGRFGEVYLLDWGLAVSLANDESGRLPLARDAVEIAGTPSYMAPEMLGSEIGILLSERTDIYLLGSILFEILHGRAPHDGSHAMAIVTAVLRSEPEVLPDAPAELARLIRRCMAREPSERPASAEEVRLAIRQFLQHRGSAELAATAEQRLGLLGDHLGARSDTDERHRERAYNLFGACRFGFQEALAGWPQNAGAAAGLERAVTLMIEYELAHDDARSAAVLLAALESPPAALRRQVERAQEKHDRALSELRELERTNDPAIGRRTRRFLGSLMGLLWTSLPLFAIRLGRTDELVGSLAVNAGLLLLTLGLGYWARDSLTKTQVNRRFGLSERVNAFETAGMRILCSERGRERRIA